MTDSERWDKLRQIIREELASCGLKPKAKVAFRDGKWTGITSEQIQGWKEAYPAVSVEQEIAKASSWIISNPQSAPKSNFARFLNAWMDRVQTRAAIRAIPLDKKALSSGEVPTCAYCGERATGTVGGVRHCRAHIYDAMDGRKIA